MNGDSIQVDMRSLIEAYESTTFRIELSDGEIALRPGRLCHELDQFLSKNGWQHAAVITAFNPRSVERTREENELENRKLEIRIASDGYSAFPGAGAGDDPDWEPEDSFLICDIDLSEALGVAQDFGQYAIAFHTFGQETVIEMTEVRLDGSVGNTP